VRKRDVIERRDEKSLPVIAEGEIMFEKIRVAIDGSPASEKALASAVDLARHYEAAVIAIGVAEVPEVVGMVDEADELRRGAEAHFAQIGEAAVAFARDRGVSLRSVVVRGHAADAIVRFAESEGVSLVVVGPHGHSRIARFFLGSTSDRVSEHCHCSVLIVK
jgi:nucleotide-binding universal stress UspA family protein